MKSGSISRMRFKMSTQTYGSGPVVEPAFLASLNVFSSWVKSALTRGSRSRSSAAAVSSAICLSRCSCSSFLALRSASSFSSTSFVSIVVRSTMSASAASHSARRLAKMGSGPGLSGPSPESRVASRKSSAASVNRRMAKSASARLNRALCQLGRVATHASAARSASAGRPAARSAEDRLL